MHRMRKIVLLLAVLSFPVPGLCFAQEGVSRASGEYQLAPLTVTVRKTEEDVQKVPVSTTVVSGAMLEDADIGDTNELTRFAPNVYFKKSTSENVISMRGVTSFDTSVYSPTAVYVDDVMLPLHYAHLADLMDIERVEILRGPQGSLYGGNSLAGVINIVTRKPDNEKRIKVVGDIGGYTGVDANPLEYTIGFGASGPVVSDRLYLGVAGNLKRGDGFRTNLFFNDDSAGEIDRGNGRFSLRWTPDARFDISLTGDFLNNDDRISVYRFDNGAYHTDRFAVSHDTDDYQKETGNSQNLRVAYRGESVEFLSVTGLRDYRNKNLQDYDCTADPFNDWGKTLSHYDDKFYSQEFRVSSREKDAPLKWLAGAFGFREETDISQRTDAIFQDAMTAIDAAGYAVFGETTLTLFKRLHLTAGLRYDVREMEGRKTDFGVSISQDLDNEEVLPKFSVGYDLADSAFGYLTVSKGYLAGGYNYSLATDTASFAYDPEYTWNYEAGIKTQWLDNRLQANLAFFYIDMTDKQVYEMAGGAAPTTRVDNAAEAHSRGVELEVQARPARGWDLAVSWGCTDAEYDDWTATEWNSNSTALTRTDYSGKKLPNVPAYTGHAGVQYRHPDGLFVRGDASFIGPLYADHHNNFEEDDYCLIDLQLGYEWERFDVVLYGKNVFDTAYNTIAYDWSGCSLIQKRDSCV